MKLREFVLANRLKIKHIVEENHCYNPTLFGSVARGEERDDSDIDILVTPDSRASLLSLSIIQLELEQLLNRSIDLVNSKTLLDLFRPSIDRDSVEL